MPYLIRSLLFSWCIAVASCAGGQGPQDSSVERDTYTDPDAHADDGTLDDGHEEADTQGLDEGRDMPQDPAGDAADGDCDEPDATVDLCSPPTGNIFEHGEFEEGMSVNAPTGWEARNPSAPGSCPGSPESHVFLGSPPPGCGGHSLVIDAGGTWDCYAVQRVSDYFTIEEGRRYRISAAVRSTGNAVNPAAWFIIGVQWVDATDSFFGDDKNPQTSSAEDNDFDWKVLTFDLVAPAGATRILVWLTAHYPGRVEYDNIAVVRVD
jgi:hypothetical protein